MREIETRARVDDDDDDEDDDHWKVSTGRKFLPKMVYRQKVSIYYSNQNNIEEI
jgi:hypothetical protein